MYVRTFVSDGMNRIPRHHCSYWIHRDHHLSPFWAAPRLHASQDAYNPVRIDAVGYLDPRRRLYCETQGHQGPWAKKTTRRTYNQNEEFSTITDNAKPMESLITRPVVYEFILFQSI